MLVINQNMTLDGSRVLYANEFIKLQETGNSSISDIIDTKVATLSGGVSESSFNSQISILQAKDAEHNSTIQSHLTLLSNHEATITSNITDIAVLNTKQQQNFLNISSTTHLLNTNYYTKSEIDRNNWIDATALAPFATTSTLTTDYYNKTEIDANNWIDATALAPFATTSTLTTDYCNITQTQNLYYDKNLY